MTLWLWFEPYSSLYLRGVIELREQTSRTIYKSADRVSLNLTEPNHSGGVGGGGMSPSWIV